MKLSEKPKWQELPLAASIVEPATSLEYKTGDWKTLKPVVDTTKCIRCATCYIFCPEAAYEENEEGYFLPNYDYCKGCGICAVECPAMCIQMVEEEAE